SSGTRLRVGRSALAIARGGWWPGVGVLTARARVVAADPDRDGVGAAVGELAADLDDLARLARSTCRRIDEGIRELDDGRAGPARAATEQLVAVRRRIAML